MKFIVVFTLCFAYAYAGGAHLAAPLAAAVVHAPVTSVHTAAVPSAAVVAKPFAVAEHGVRYDHGVAYSSVPVNKVINVPTERYAVGPDNRGFQFTSEVRHDAGYLAGLKAPVAAYAAGPVAAYGAGPVAAYGAGPVAAYAAGPVAAYGAAPVAHAAYAGPIAAPVAYGASYAAGIDHVAAAPVAAAVAAPIAAPLAAPIAAPIAAYGGVVKGAGLAAPLAAPFAAPVAAYGGVVKGAGLGLGLGYGAAIAGPVASHYGGVVGETVGAPIFAGQEPAIAKGYATETGRHELHQAVVHEPAVIPTAVKESYAVPGVIRGATAHQVPVQVGVHSEPIVAPVVNKHVGLAQVGVAPVGVKGLGFAAPLAKW